MRAERIHVSLEWDWQRRKGTLMYWFWHPAIQGHTCTYCCDGAVVCEGIWSV